jgi:hypothetical protein
MFMEEVHSAANASLDLVESPTYAHPEALERAIGKLVLLGKQVDVNADQMIQLLESGLTVAELVVHVALLNKAVSSTKTTGDAAS